LQTDQLRAGGRRLTRRTRAGSPSALNNPRWLPPPREKGGVKRRATVDQVRVVSVPSYRRIRYVQPRRGPRTCRTSGSGRCGCPGAERTRWSHKRSSAGLARRRGRAPSRAREGPGDEVERIDQLDELSAHWRLRWTPRKRRCSSPGRSSLEPSLDADLLNPSAPRRHICSTASRGISGPAWHSDSRSPGTSTV
jgi:hypothetical protein